MVTGFQFSVTTPYFHTDQYVQQAHNTCKNKYAILLTELKYRTVMQRAVYCAVQLLFSNSAAALNDKLAFVTAVL